MKKNIFLIMLAILELTSVHTVLSEAYNWEKVSYPSGLNDQDTFHSIHAFNMNEAIAVGSKGLVKYVNIEENIYSIIYNCSNTYRWVSFADSVHGWVVGDSGCIAATTDRGKTWTTQNSGVTSHLNAVAAVDKNHAWIAGDSGIILYTSDGGKNWIRQSYENIDITENYDGDCIDFVSVAFKNGEIGCVGGNWRSSNISVAMVTCDSGVNWSGVRLSGYSVHFLYEVAYHNEMLLIYAEGFPDEKYQMKIENGPCLYDAQIIRKTLQNLNHGQFQHFCSKHRVVEFQGISKRTILAIDSIKPFQFWIAGTRGSIYRTGDNGMNWLAVCSTEDFFIDDLESVFFCSSQRGFIGGRNGTFLCSEDGGNSWQLCLKKVNAYESFRDIVFYDSLNGYLIRHDKKLSKDAILGTEDGGKNWSVKRGSSEIEYLRVVSNEGMISYDKSHEISFCHDKGKSWRTQTIKTEFPLVDIFPITLDTLFALGIRNNRIEGAIFKSTDGGESFDLVSSVDHADSKYKSFRSITFSDAATGWIAGDSGIILKTIDSGYTWQRQPSPTTADLIEIHFRSPDFGWASGENCRLYLTFDGGDTWADKSILTSTKVNDVFCSDPQNCWAVGDDGLILHLSNKLDKYINITFPGGNETFVIGDSITVKWNSNGISQVSISISYDGGKNYTGYRNATDNDGEETIRISANATASDSCKMRISSVDGTVTDESSYFTITQTSAVENRSMSLKNHGCYFKGASIHYYLTEDASIESTIFTVSGREVYRNRIPLQGKGPGVQKFTSGILKRGCYLAQVNIGGKYFKGKLIILR